MKYQLEISFVLFVLLLFMTPNRSVAQIYDTVGPSTFKVDSVGVISSPTPHVGDTIHMLIKFHANVTGAAVFKLGFSANIQPPSWSDTETSLDSSIVVDSGTEYTYSIPLKLFGYGGSLLDALFSADTAPPTGIMNYGYNALEIESSSTSFKILNHGSNANDTGTMTAEGSLGSGAHITLTGQVLYEDVDQEFSEYNPPVGTSHTRPTIMKGAYGVTVVLLFHSLSESGGVQDCPTGALDLNFTHPVSGCLSGVHYCKCDADGNFSFNFSISDPTWANYGNAELLVTASNDAVLLKSDPGYEVSTYRINGSGTTCAPWTTFRETYGLCIPCNNTALISQTGIKMSNPLNSIDGPILRNSEMAREFDSTPRVGITPAQILTEITSVATGNDEFVDAYPNPNYLQFDPVPPSSAVVDHECGHYCNYLLLGGTLPLNHDLKEGWAQFHSEVARWYTRANYGDYIDQTGDFEKVTFDGKTHDGTTQAACFLCNVYDKYNDAGFRDPDYESYDNDDVGEPSAIFSVTRFSYDMANIGTFKDNIETFLGLSTEDCSATPPPALEKCSIEKIYQLTTGDASTPMRPAQVKNLTASIVEGGGGNYIANLSWEPQNYTSGDYINLQSGIKIYQNSGSTPIRTLSASATSASINIGPECFGGSTFLVTTYNSSGNSYGAPTVWAAPPCSEKMADGHPGSALDTSTFVVTVHPNPASGIVKVCVADLPGGIPVVVDVVNQMGASVATLYNATPESELGLCLSLDCSMLPSGIYFADLQTEGTHNAVKFTVSH